MNITIVGAGALGTIMAAHLIEAGQTVSLVARGARAKDVAANGLRLRGLKACQPNCEVITDPGAIGETDLLIFAVKTYHMEDALDGLAGAKPSAVFSLANGVLKNEQLANAFGSGRVLGCMANFSGELEDSGTVMFTRNVRLAIGPMPDYDGPSPRAIAELINASGLHTDATSEIQTVEWSKFTGWVALFVISLIARTTTGDALRNRQFARLGAELIRETARIAEDRGIGLVDQSPLPVATVAAATLDGAEQHLLEVGADLAREAPDHRMSSLQDLAAGRRLEVHETLGYAVNETRRLGHEAPTLELCYRLAHGLDALNRNT